MRQETYIHVKRELFSIERDLCTCEKRRIHMLKETYIHVERNLSSIERDIYTCGKRRINMLKETFVSSKEVHIHETKDL